MFGRQAFKKIIISGKNFLKTVLGQPYQLQNHQETTK